MTEVTAADGADETDVGEHASGRGLLRWWREDPHHRSEQLAAALFALYVVAAVPIVLLGVGSYHWFLRDEWNLLAQRDGGSLHDVFAPHFVHWVTVPILIYRVLWRVFGIDSYVPYQAVVLGMHLASAVLLRVIMRRAGVGAWIATLTAAVFVLFGSGRQNIVWAFQITLVGSLLFVLVQLVLADHDGRIGRRDVLGLGSGLLGLMSSGAAIPIIGAVGLATLLRRGWRAALFHTVPLAAAQVAWQTYWKPKDELDRLAPTGFGDQVTAVRQFAQHGLVSTVEAIGYFWPVGVALLVLLLVGLPLAWVPLDLATFRRRAALPLALLVGWVLFYVVVGYGRRAFGPEIAESPRYLHVGAALLLPAIAVAADAVVRRWRAATPVVVAVLVAAIVGNVAAFGDRGAFNEAFFDRQELLVPLMAHSPYPEQVPAWVTPTADEWEGITAGFLAEGARSGRIPELDGQYPAIQSTFPVRFGLGIVPGVLPTGTCRSYAEPQTLRMAPGDRLGLRRGNVDVTVVREDGSESFPYRFKSGFDGLELEATLDEPITFRVSSSPEGAPMQLCFDEALRVDG